MYGVWAVGADMGRAAGYAVGSCGVSAAPEVSSAAVAPSPHAFMVNGEVFFDPHPGKQLALVRRCADRVLRGLGPPRKFVRGPRGTGKSMIGRRGVCHALAMAVPGLKYVVVRRNMPDLRKNHLIYVGREMRALGGAWNQTFGQATYPNGSLGFFSQCEDESDAEKIIGFEGAVLLIDEAPQIPWELQSMMRGSLRVPLEADGTQPYYTLEMPMGNPVGEAIEEMDRYYVEHDVDPLEDPEYRAEDWETIRLELKDNLSIDAEEYLKQFTGLPEHYRRAWVDGERMDARTLFDVSPTITAKLCEQKGGEPREQPWPEEWIGRPYHVIQELPRVGDTPLLETPGMVVYRAFDMGYFPDPAVCLWFAVYGKRVIAFHEETWFRHEADELAKAIVETTRELIGEAVPVAETLVDPQIAVRQGVVTVMDTLEMGGVPCTPSINDRVLYADAIHGLLGLELEPGVPRFQILEPGCPMLTKYLPKMRWDEKQTRKMANHKFDHWPVALAYFAISSGVLGTPQEVKEQARPAWMDWIDEGRGRRRVQ